jgi:hypothetical protein
MPSQSFGTNGLGFRHLIEDGLAILDGRPINPDRRAYVVKDLSQLVLQAKRGSDLVRSNALSVASDDRNAFESYSILDRYWDRSREEQWTQVLAKAGEAFDCLQKGVVRDLREDQRNAAANLLRTVLSGLIKEPKPGVSSQPEELRIGS